MPSTILPLCPDFSTLQSAKNREKAQEKAPAKNVNFFVAFFDVSGVVYFLIFFLSTEISKIFKLHYIKISESQKAPLFWFLRFAQFAKRKAQRRGKKRHFCAKSQDLDTLDTSVFQAALLWLISNPHKLKGTKVKLWLDSQSTLQSIFSLKPPSRQSAGGRHHRTVSVSEIHVPNRAGLDSRTLRYYGK